MEIEFGLLGDICAYADGRMVDLGPARQRCVLAVLLVHANRVVRLDQLVDEVWGEAPPQQVSATVRPYLSRLRAALSMMDGCGIRRRSGGVVVDVDASAVDLHRFRDLVARARAGADAEASVLYERALGLWRGEALAGLDTPWATSVRAALHTERLLARLDHHDVRLRLGEHASLVPDLVALVGTHPLDERLAGQLLLAQYRDGQQAAALAHYERLRRRLDEELGVRPGSDLQRLHQRILDADPALDPPVPSTGPSLSRGHPVPRQLPAAPPGFTSRERELAALDAAWASAGETMTICAIGGCGGVGKTWLALYWAHRHLDAFPDGQLHVNLRGYDPAGAPMTPEAAVRLFLDALAVDPARVPVDPQAQAALYRSLVADKRLLVVLDNARDTAQVGPLLPGGAGCAVLVTSRHQLTGLVTAHGARPVTLDVLDPPAAHQLLAHHLGARRIAEEPRAVTTVVERCAGLPLALTIAAARAAMHPDRPLAALADELGQDTTRLDVLDAGELGVDLRAVFASSYQALSEPTARVFRLLGIHPGPDVDHAALAALAGLPPDQLRPALAELHRAHLLTEHTPGRYTLHDLLRSYAAEQARTNDTAEQRRTATHRMLDHYLHTAYVAALRLYPHRHPIHLPAPHPGARPLPIDGPAQAAAWFTAEHPVLLAAVHHAADADFPAHTWQLAWAMADYLDHRGHWHDLLATQRTALTATQRTDDREGQAHGHTGINRAHARLGHPEHDHTHARQALALFTDLGDHANQAHTHQALAFLAELEGHSDQALAHAHRARDLYQAIDHRAGLAFALNTIGWYQVLLGNHHEAIDHCRRALALHQELGHPHGQAATWDSLAYAHHHLGQHDQALDCYQRAIRLFHQVGDQYDEADTLMRLGDTRHAAGHPEAAHHTWQRAVDILEQLGHPDADQVHARLRSSRPDGTDPRAPDTARR